MTQPLKPQFFVIRQNNSMVPLIALDELPPHVQIRDVSRTLSPIDIAGMTCVGTAEARHTHYIFDIPSTQNNTNSVLVDRSLMASKYAPTFEQELSEDRPGIAASCHQGPPKAYGIQEQPPASHPSVIISNPAHRVDRKAEPLPQWHETNLTVKHAPGVKQYCSYWLRHGECDYAQQGCLYKHEMPLDPEVLESLGHRDIPAWYRAKHALASLHAPKGVIKDEKSRAIKERSWRRDGSSARSGNTTLSAEQIKSAAMSSSSMHYTSPRAASPIRPAETMHAKQQKATLLQIRQFEEDKNRRKEALPESMKGLKLGGIFEDKPSTESGSSPVKESASTAGSGTTILTPNTTPEISDDDLLLLSGAEDNPTPTAPVANVVVTPITTDNSSRIPKALSTQQSSFPKGKGTVKGNGQHASNNSGKSPGSAKKTGRAVRSRRRVASESSSDAGSVAAAAAAGRVSGRAGKAAEAVEAKRYQGYDHDD